MKRLALYALILTLVWIVPVERTDVAKLSPIEVIAVYQTADGVQLQTDTGDFGSGADAMAALEHMRQTSSAVIYLDTAEFLLIGQGAETASEELRKELKDSVKLCGIKERIQLTNVAAYLELHGSLPVLERWSEENPLPLLTEKRGRYLLQ